MNIWEGRKAMEQYESEAYAAIPDRCEMRSMISRLATDETSGSPTIADLGGGLETSPLLCSIRDRWRTWS